MDPLSQFPPEYVNFNDGGVVVRTTIAMSIVSTLVVGLRVYARFSDGTLMKLDDWLIIASLPFLYSTMLCAVISVYYGGVGRHLPIVMITAPEEFSTALLCLFIAESIYATVIFLIKASILSMYRRVFPTRFMIRASWYIGVAVGLWWAAVVAVSLAQCQPLHRAWNPTMTEGHCIDVNKYLISNAVPNIATDVVMLCLPMYEIRRLHMARSKKFGIAAIFLLGSLVVVISGIRLKIVYDMTLSPNTSDMTALLAPAWIWTVLEPAIGVICACLPTIKSLTHVLFGRIFGSSTSSDENNNNNNNPPGFGPRNRDSDGNPNALLKTIITIGGGRFNPARGARESPLPLGRKQQQQQQQHKQRQRGKKKNPHSAGTESTWTATTATTMTAGLHNDEDDDDDDDDDYDYYFDDGRRRVRHRAGSGTSFERLYEFFYFYNKEPVNSNISNSHIIFGGAPMLRPVTADRSLRSYGSSNTINGRLNYYQQQQQQQQQQPRLGLWPQGYANHREVMVHGRETPSLTSDDLPMESISVKREVDWVENKAGN